MHHDPARNGPSSPPLPQMKKQDSARPVERLYSFVLRSRILMVGRDTLARSKSKLHFVLITRDISETSRAEILSDFAHYPVVQHYTSEELQRFFGIKRAKVIGFEKSGLARSLYAELKEHRINRPAVPPSHLGGAG
jgi:ribosomal protein L7Ae-like RNA K-turn-binding protein